MKKLLKSYRTFLVVLVAMLLLIDIPGIIIIALIISKLVSKKEVKELYENANTMD